MHCAIEDIMQIQVLPDPTPGLNPETSRNMNQLAWKARTLFNPKKTIQSVLKDRSQQWKTFGTHFTCPVDESDSKAPSSHTSKGTKDATNNPTIWKTCIWQEKRPPDSMYRLKEFMSRKLLFVIIVHPGIWYHEQWPFLKSQLTLVGPQLNLNQNISAKKGHYPGITFSWRCGWWVEAGGRACTHSRVYNRKESCKHAQYECAFWNCVDMLVETIALIATGFTRQCTVAQVCAVHCNYSCWQQTTIDLFNITTITCVCKSTKINTTISNSWEQAEKETIGVQGKRLKILLQKTFTNLQDCRKGCQAAINNWSNGRWHETHHKYCEKAIQLLTWGCREMIA